jgi:nucleoside-diphosphate-sugar epimerase
MKLANNTKVLITGSSGFIGTEISQLLVSNNYEVFGLKHKNRSQGNLGGDNYQSLNGDLASGSHIPHLPNNLDVIIHCAAILPNKEVPVSGRSEIFALNEAMALNVCQIAKAHNVRLVIFASTANMYKNSLEVAFEDSEIAPKAEKEYFQSKLNAEFLIQEGLAESGISLSILRVATPFGPGENPGKVIPTFHNKKNARHK